MIGLLRLGQRATCCAASHLLEKDPNAGPQSRSAGRNLLWRRIGMRIAGSGCEAIAAHAGRIAMVFQQFNLWAHMTALENIIEAPMQVLGPARAVAVARAERYLERVGWCRASRARMPIRPNVRWRTAARGHCPRPCLEPEVMLFDEPTSALDRNWWARFCASCAPWPKKAGPWWW